MSSQSFYMIVAVFAAGWLVVTAMPHPKTVDLSEAVNRTVCPIEVDVDEDPDRVPRRIKIIKCAPNPNEWCKERHIPKHECCAHTHHHGHDHVMECVQIQDQVLVYYPKSDSPKKAKLYTVAVGCTCMVEQSTQAAPAT